MLNTFLGELNLTKIGERLKKTDSFILEILMIRLANGGLSDLVAEAKVRDSPDGIFHKRRPDIEDKRIASMKKWAIKKGVDPNFAAGLMYSIISESCRRQDDLMVNNHKNHTINIDEHDSKKLYKFQRGNLLELTKTIANEYDKSYGTGLLGSNLYFSFEKKILNEMLNNMPQNNKLALDLGCATGDIAFRISAKFDKVIGYDVSADMINVAQSKISEETSHVEFINADIEKGINLPENSVSLAIMNMGTAGDIKNIQGVLSDLKKSLEPGGKFLLSFYNSESLLQRIGFIPWSIPLAAHIDIEKRCLEVHHGGKIYFIYAKPRNVKEVRSLLSDFEIDNIITFPTVASLIPNILTESEDERGEIKPNKLVHELVEEIDIQIANSDLNCGSYIIVTGGKHVQ